MILDSLLINILLIMLLKPTLFILQLPLKTKIVSFTSKVNSKFLDNSSLIIISWELVLPTSRPSALIILVLLIIVLLILLSKVPLYLPKLSLPTVSLNIPRYISRVARNEIVVVFHHCMLMCFYWKKRQYSLKVNENL